MKRIYLKDQIATVADRFERSYPAGSVLAFTDTPRAEVVASLRRLDPNTATSEDVAAIIGNPSWVDFSCDECGAKTDSLIRVGEEPDHDSRWQDLCKDCLTTALAMSRD